MTKQEKQIEEGARLDDFINSLKINGKRFAKEVGVSQALVSGTTTGVKPITRDFVNKITERYPEFRESWLFTGEGPMISKNSLVDNYQIEVDPVPTVQDLEAKYKADPLYGLRDLIARVEALERWKEDQEFKMSLNKDE